MCVCVRVVCVAASITPLADCTNPFSHLSVLVNTNVSLQMTVSLFLTITQCREKNTSGHVTVYDHPTVVSGQQQ